MVNTLYNTLKIHKRSNTKSDQNHCRLLIMVQFIGLTMGQERAIN